MREILFRGKREDNGEWITGMPCATEQSGIYAIQTLQGGIFDIIPETIGQFTGFTDANCQKIFEGDIVRTRRDSVRTEKLKGYYGFDSDGYPQKVPGYEGETEYHYKCMVDCYAEVVYRMHNGFCLNGSTMFVSAICNEVVGNIYDNPELLKQEVEQ